MDNMLDRLAATGMTLAQAFVLDDATLLRHPTIGRKTLHFIRSYNGPMLPVPVAYVAPRKATDEPLLADFTDADGYADYEAYDVAWDAWRDRIDFERDQLPDLRESWCGEPAAQPVDDPTENDWLFDLIRDHDHAYEGRGY